MPHSTQPYGPSTRTIIHHTPSCPSIIGRHCQIILQPYISYYLLIHRPCMNHIFNMLHQPFLGSSARMSWPPIIIIDHPCSSSSIKRHHASIMGTRSFALSIIFHHTSSLDHASAFFCTIFIVLSHFIIVQQRSSQLTFHAIFSATHQ